MDNRRIYRQPPAFNPAVIKSEVDKHCDEARAELTKYGIPQSFKAKIAIALDVSRSMEFPNGFYSSKAIEKLIMKAMSMAIELSSDEKHSVTIFPFAKVAFTHIKVDEDNLQNVIQQVEHSIGFRLVNGAVPENSLKTNYNVVTKNIREHYFGHSSELNAKSPIIPAEEAIFCLFVTDGEPNLEVNAAKTQFQSSEYNAIFFKFIALLGQQEDLKFNTLQEICAIRKGAIPNKDLVILEGPEKLTMVQLFNKFRTWAEEAFEHKLLKHDPHFNLNKNNKHDREELKFRNTLNKEHGHDISEQNHGHVDADDDDEHQETNTFSNVTYVLFGLAGAITFPLLVTSIPLIATVLIGAGIGLLAHSAATAIYDVWAWATGNANDHGSDDDSDDENDHQNPQPLSDNMRTFQQLQSASHSAAPQFASQQQYVYQPPSVLVQYQPLPHDQSYQNQPPPPYSYHP